MRREMYNVLSSCFLIAVFTSSNVAFGQTETAMADFYKSKVEWANQQLKGMSLRDKIAQSFIIHVPTYKGEQAFEKIDSLIINDRVGGLVLGRGEYEQTKNAIRRFQEHATFPLLMAMDATWGLSKQIWRSKKYPFPLALGAVNEDEWSRTLSTAMSHDMRKLGVNFCLGPTINISSPDMDEAGQMETYGEDPMTVATQSRAFIQGLQQNNVLSAMKYFPFHPDKQGDNDEELLRSEVSLEQLQNVHWAPFRMGRLSRASAVMMANMEVPALDDSGIPVSFSSKVIQETLKNELKFDGLVISGNLGDERLTRYFDADDIDFLAYTAGNDLLLNPGNPQQAIERIMQAVNEGEYSEKAIDRKCLKILQAKYHVATGKDTLAYPSTEELSYIETATYEKAITVLKNDSVLPVKDALESNLVINLGNDAGAFRDRLEEYSHAKYVHAYSAEEVLRYMENYANTYDNIFINIFPIRSLTTTIQPYPVAWRKVLENIPAAVNSYVTFYGHPFIARDWEVFAKADAVILTYEQELETLDRVAQLLFGGFQSKTPLPVTLNEVFQEGFYAATPAASRMKYTVPMEFGLRKSDFRAIDSIAEHGIREKAYPGCQIVIAKDGKLIYEKSFGHQTYDSLRAIENNTLYDLASVTKIAASTASLMHLQGKGQFSLDARLRDYLEITRGTAYERILLKDMMAHQAGLSPWIPFYTKTLTDGLPSEKYYSRIPNDSMKTQVAQGLFIRDDYEETIYDRILSTRLKPRGDYRYSDLGYYFVKRIVEQQSALPMEKFVHSTFYEPMGLRTMRYHPLEEFSIQRIAPTERDNYFRHQLVHGYVHDMGAAMTDGVGGHAGVFSNAADLAKMMQLFLNQGTYGRREYIPAEVIESYTSCQFCPDNRRGAGFDKPVRDLQGGPTCELVSLESFGHSGFTGTQAWADPANGVNYVFLSNRVYPKGDNWKLVKMDIRTDIQKEIYKLFPVRNENK
ncbi:MAG: glycoside hydrolase family 3 N-terminal domain-containing protein [Bacteroidota bacterium]